MKGKKLTGILIAAVIVLLVCVVGTTFAYYFATLRGKNENTISTSKATLLLTEQDNPYNSVLIGRDETTLQEWRPGYDFSVSIKSDGKASIAYALYIEPSKGNTIDPSMISVSVSKIDENGEEYQPYPYYYYQQCRSLETDEIIALDRCEYIEELREEIYKGVDVEENSNPYGAAYIEHRYIEEIMGEGDIKCIDTITYYTREIVGENHTQLNYAASEEEIVDYSYCKYRNEDVGYGKSVPLVGEGSYANLFRQMPYEAYFNNNETAELKQKYLIYNETISSNNDTSTINYRLRYFINSDRLSGEIAEGTVNQDGSVSVDLGQDGIFKFRIGVYAKSISALFIINKR